MSRTNGLASFLRFPFLRKSSFRRRTKSRIPVQVDCLEVREVLSASVVPVADINQKSQGVTLRHDTVQLTESVSVFSLNLLGGTTEIWRTDGTTQGTFRLGQFAGGNDRVSSLVKSGSTVFFSYRQSWTRPAELWKTDGSLAGTTRVKAFDDYSWIDLSAMTAAADGNVLFLREHTLWRSDGTANGTTAVVNLQQFSSDSLGTSLLQRIAYAPGLPGGPTAIVNDGVFGGSYSNRLFSINLTTSQVQVLYSDQTIELWGAQGDHLLFETTGLNSGLWTTRGTPESTLRMSNKTDQGKDIREIQLQYMDSEAVVFTALGESINGSSTQLYMMRSDETFARLISPGAFSFRSPLEVQRVGSNYVVSRSDGVFSFTSIGLVLNRVSSGGKPLDLLNGQTQAYYAIESDDRSRIGLLPTTGDPSFEGSDRFTAFGTFIGGNANGVFFIADNGTTGLELWRSDGRLQTTVLVREFETGTIGSSAKLIAAANGNVLFTADDGSGLSWYSLNGATSVVTKLVNGRDILIESTLAGGSPNLPQFKAAVILADGDITRNAILGWDGTAIRLLGYFENDSTHLIRVANLSGSPLLMSYSEQTNQFSGWRLDERRRATEQLFSIDATDAPSDVFQSGGKLFFVMDETSSPSSESVLWQTDGTSAGTKRVEWFPWPRGTFHYQTTPIFGDSVAFATGYDFRGLRMLDTKTGLVKEYADLFQRNDFVKVTAVADRPGGMVFFAKESGLWLTHGMDRPIQLKSLNGHELIGAYRTDSDRAFFMTQYNLTTYLWVTDGTAAGTRQVLDYPYRQFNREDSNRNTTFLVQGGSVYFSVYNGNAGRTELWKSDGTTEGTVRLTDAMVFGDYAKFMPYGGGVVMEGENRAFGAELFRIEMNRPAATPAGVTLKRDGQQAQLFWEDTIGATQYDVLVRDLSNLSLPSKQYQTTFNSLGLVDGAGGRLIEQNRVYRVWVRGRSLTGAVSAWSSALDVWLTNPEVIAPTTASLNRRPEIRWTTPAGTVSSDVWITNRDTQVRAVYQTGIRGTSFIPGSDLATGRYAVFVRSLLVNGRTTDWSPAVEFHVVQPAISVTTQGTLQRTSTPEFKWPKFEGATHYELIISRADGSVALQVQKYYVTEYRANVGLSAGGYIIRVRAMKGSSPLTDSGAGLSFVLLVPPRSLTGNRASLLWESTPIAATYTVELLNAKGQLAIPRTVTTSALLNLPQTLPAGQYSFRVFTNSRFGSSAWSERRTFEIGQVLAASLPTATIPGPEEQLRLFWR
ncbi:MAG: hypothetical protein JNM43_23275 [Planctomycetaceae bacterium]|nr:hypothetical protein [Planctomycetaceae bacterium]